MLSKKIIYQKTNASTYSRGMDIFTSNRIKDFLVVTEKEFDSIKASVRGTGRNIYDVSGIYNTEIDLIEEISCDCPAYSSYKGLCKHCVAVLLNYIDHSARKEMSQKKEPTRQSNFDLNYLMKTPIVNEVQEVPTLEQILLEQLPPTQLIQNTQWDENSQQGQNSQVQILRNRGPVTSPAMKELLSNRMLKRTLPLIQDATYGKVRLEPLLNFSFHEATLEFKIGTSHMYVLKDIFAFASSFDKNINVQYGQKLQFIHAMEAFEETQRPLVQFIRNWTQKNASKYMQQSYYGNYYNYTQVKLRNLPLNGSDLEDFLVAVNCDSLMANILNSGERYWEITKEELPLELMIKAKDKGIEVKINHFSGYQGIDKNIYFHQGKIYQMPHEKFGPILDFLDCMDKIPERSVYLQKEDVPTFSRELLPVLEKFFQCTKENFDEEEYGIVPASFEIYLDSPQRDFITCKIMAVYGEKKFNIYDKSDELMRDKVREIEIGKLVSSYCNAYDEKEQVMVVGQEDDKLYELLTYGIPQMQEVADLYISDTIKRLKVIAAPKVAIGVSVAGERMELSMTSDDMSKDQLLEILTKYNRKKKFYRLKNGDFVNVEGDEINALLELKQGLNLSDSQLKQELIVVPKYRALFLDAEFKEMNSLAVTKDKAFKALVRNMKTVEDNDFDIPSSLETILREYQKRGFLWIKTLKNNGFGGILADDMGLGKTLQVICFLLSEFSEAKPEDNRRTLIVCPASLVFNWQSEFNKFAPMLTVKTLTGTLLERKKILETSENRDILVTSYDLLKRDMEFYAQIELYCEIIDEAQYIKNHNTQVAKAVKGVDASFKLALTGTPIENRLSELWSIFDYLMPGFLYSYQRFRDELEIPIVQNQEEAPMKRLQKMISPFVLRRLKKEVLTDLPDKLEECIYTKMEGEQQKLYDAHVKKLQLMLNKQTNEEFKTSKIQILSELTKLRQICCDPTLLFEDFSENSAKIELCMDMIENAVSGGHKILLFSQFTSMLENIQKRLTKENISFYSLTGATSKENRAKLVDRFNHDSTSVFCISLKAGGTGLNLTAADIVIHFDPWWNLAVQNQATDRAHRIGQKNVVSVYKLIVKGTIEENIVKIQELKKELAEQVFGGETVGSGSFSREELMELLK